MLGKTEVQRSRKSVSDHDSKPGSPDLKQECEATAEFALSGVVTVCGHAVGLRSALRASFHIHSNATALTMRFGAFNEGPHVPAATILSN